MSQPSNFMRLISTTPTEDILKDYDEPPSAVVKDLVPILHNYLPHAEKKHIRLGLSQILSHGSQYSFDVETAEFKVRGVEGVCCLVRRC